MRLPVVLASMLLAGPAWAGGGVIYVTTRDGTPARVFLDGVDTGLQTPAQIEDVPPGQHYVQVRGDCVADNAPVDVVAGEVARLVLDPEPANGFLDLRIQPPQGEVLVDGQPVGRGPNLVHEVGCGTHRIEVRAPGYLTEVREIDVAMGSARQLRFRLVPEGMGVLSVVLEPPTAQLVVDGQPVAVGSMTLPDIAAGVHRVRASAPGYVSEEREVRVQAGATTTLRIELQPERIPGPAAPGAAGPPSPATSEPVDVPEVTLAAPAADQAPASPPARSPDEADPPVAAEGAAPAKPPPSPEPPAATPGPAAVDARGWLAHQPRARVLGGTALGGVGLVAEAAGAGLFLVSWRAQQDMLAAVEACKAVHGETGLEAAACADEVTADWTRQVYWPNRIGIGLMVGGGVALGGSAVVLFVDEGTPGLAFRRAW